MSQLPLADATPLRVTGILFKDLVFAFEPQDIPDGARTVRMLRASLLTSLASIRPESTFGSIGKQCNYRGRDGGRVYYPGRP